MVCADLAAFRVAPAIIEAGAYSALHRLYHLFVFHLDAVESRSDAALAQRRIPHVRHERDFRPARALRRDDVERQSPRIEVEHDVGEQPEVKRADALARVRMLPRQIERRLTRLGDSELEIPVAKALGAIARVV